MGTRPEDEIIHKKIDFTRNLALRMQASLRNRAFSLPNTFASGELWIPRGVCFVSASVMRKTSGLFQASIAVGLRGGGEAVIEVHTAREPTTGGRQVSPGVSVLASGCECIECDSGHELRQFVSMVSFRGDSKESNAGVTWNWSSTISDSDGPFEDDRPVTLLARVTGNDLVLINCVSISIFELP
jgi:hypothetical protein